MANDDNVLKKFLNWNSGWEDWEITDDEPPVPADSDLDKFDSLIERPTPALKTWMEEYIYAYWNEGLNENDRPERRALFYGNSVRSLPDREREGVLLERFWNSVSDFESDMIRESKKHRVAYFEAKVKQARRKVNLMNSILEHYKDVLDRVRNENV